jgi:hypothetical protein
MYPSHLSVDKPYLDAPGMIRGFGQQGTDNSVRQFACSLIFFEHDSHMQPGMDVFAVFSCHGPGFFLYLYIFAIPLYFITCGAKAQSRLMT